MSGMKKEYGELTAEITKLLENDPGQPVEDLAKKLGVNRTFLAGYLKALENQVYVKSKKGMLRYISKENKMRVGVVKRE